MGITAAGHGGLQAVIGLPETNPGKEFVAIAVSRKGSRFPDQAPDQMVVVNELLVLAQQPGQRKGMAASNISFQGLGMHPHSQGRADQPGRHRISVG